MNRLRIGFVAVVAAVGALGLATPASAVCDPLLSEVFDRCVNSCTLPGIVYREVQENVEGLPSIECAA